MLHRHDQFENTSTCGERPQPWGPIPAATCANDGEPTKALGLTKALVLVGLGVLCWTPALAALAVWS